MGRRLFEQESLFSEYVAMDTPLARLGGWSVRTFPNERTARQRFRAQVEQLLGPEPILRLRAAIEALPHGKRSGTSRPTRIFGDDFPEAA